MSQDILLRINQILREKENLHEDQFKLLLNLFAKYKNAEWIYPGVLVRKTGIEREIVYRILELLRHAGILELNYELYCHACNKFISNHVYESFLEIPEDLFCDDCGDELNIKDNVIIIYKVIVTDEAKDV